MSRYLGIRGVASIGSRYQWGTGLHYTGGYGEATLLSNSWSNFGNGWNYGGFQHNIGLYEYSSKNYADFNIGTPPDKFGHSSIEGEYNGEDLKLSVGTGYNDNKTALSKITSDRTGQSHFNGSSIRLVGATLRKLSQFSHFIKYLFGKGLLPYNSILFNCSFYTSMALNYAGINDYYIIIPRLEVWQLELTGGRGF